MHEVADRPVEVGGAVGVELEQHLQPLGVEPGEHVRGRVLVRHGCLRFRGVVHCSSPFRPFQPVRQCSRESSRVDGLREVVVHARGQAALALALDGGGGHRDDGHPVVGLAVADLAGGGVPVEDRHLHVHEDRVPATLGPGVHPGAAVVDDAVLVAQELQDAARDHLVHRVVLDDEDAATGGPGVGDELLVHRQGVAPDEVDDG